MANSTGKEIYLLTRIHAFQTLNISQNRRLRLSIYDDDYYNAGGIERHSSTGAMPAPRLLTVRRPPAKLKRPLAQCCVTTLWGIGAAR